jgi:acyl carrier protein
VSFEVDPDPVTTRLAELWRDVLRTDHIDEDSDFFALGGHSLLAVRLSVFAGEAFGVELGPADLIADSSFTGMVERVKAAASVAVTR